MYRSIIVPLDGSDFGHYALPYGIALARRTGAAMKLVHVHQPYMPGEALEANPHYRFQGVAEFDSRADENARRAESDRLWKLAEELQSEGITATAHVLNGRVPDAISSFARESGAGVIVMSTHGHSGFQRLWLGSVADAVVRHSSTPVLLVRPGESAEPPSHAIKLERILVPVDGSSFSASIIGPVSSLAADDPVRVTFFRVEAPRGNGDSAFSPLGPSKTVAAPGTVPDGFLDHLLEDAPANLAGAERLTVTNRSPALAILHEAQARDYDLIAMTTHGIGSTHHLLLGSTADKVMRGTVKPILLFRPHGVAKAPVTETAVVTEEFVAEHLFVVE